jgi:hypothetical protein
MIAWDVQYYWDNRIMIGLLILAWRWVQTTGRCGFRQIYADDCMLFRAYPTETIVELYILEISPSIFQSFACPAWNSSV